MGFVIPVCAKDGGSVERTSTVRSSILVRRLLRKTQDLVAEFAAEIGLMRTQSLANHYVLLSLVTTFGFHKHTVQYVSDGKAEHGCTIWKMKCMPGLEVLRYPAQPQAYLASYCRACLLRLNSSVPSRGPCPIELFVSVMLLCMHAPLLISPLAVIRWYNTKQLYEAGS